MKVISSSRSVSSVACIVQWAMSLIHHVSCSWISIRKQTLIFIKSPCHICRRAFVNPTILSHDLMILSFTALAAGQAICCALSQQHISVRLLQFNCRLMQPVESELESLKIRRHTDDISIKGANFEFVV